MPTPRTAPPRRRSLTTGGFTAGVAFLGIVGAALAGCEPDSSTNSGAHSGSPASTRSASPSSSSSTGASASHAPASPSSYGSDSKQEKELKKFYTDYVAAGTTDRETMREGRLSAHYRDDLTYRNKHMSPNIDGALHTEHDPVDVGTVSHDSTIGNHSWFLVDLKWKNDKVPVKDCDGTDDECEYEPTKLRVQVDRDTNRISDVAEHENKAGPGQDPTPDE